VKPAQVASIMGWMSYDYTTIYNLSPKVHNAKPVDKIKHGESDLQIICFVNILIAYSLSSEKDVI
jgi:hypothetical protein